MSYIRKVSHYFLKRNIEMKYLNLIDVRKCYTDKSYQTQILTLGNFFKCFFKNAQLKAFFDFNKSTK